MANEGRPKMIIDSPDEVLSTMSADGKRRWLYPVLSVGKFWQSRRVIAWTLIVLFTALPWLKIGEKPSVFIDIMRREFTFLDRKSTRLNSSHVATSYAVFCLTKKILNHI